MAKEKKLRMDPAKADHVAAEYMSNGYNKRQALLATGYSDTTAGSAAPMIFAHPMIQAAIEKRRERLQSRFELTEDWVVGQLVERAKSGKILAQFRKVDDDGTLYWDFEGATEEELALVTELGVEFYTEGRGGEERQVKKFKLKEPDVHGALMALGRHLGIFNDKLEVSGLSLEARLEKAKEQAAPPPPEAEMLPEEK